MQKLLVLYFYPKQLALGMILPGCVYFLVVVSSSYGFDIFTLKLILYFGFIYYLAYLSYKNYEHQQPKIDLNLNQLQLMCDLFDYAGIDSAVEKVQNEIFHYIKPDHSVYDEDTETDSDDFVY